MIGHYYFLLFFFFFSFFLFPFFLEGTIPPVWTGFLAWPCESVESCGGSVGLFGTMANAAATLAGTRLARRVAGGLGSKRPLPTGSRLPTKICSFCFRRALSGNASRGQHKSSSDAVYPKHTVNGTVASVIYRDDESQFNILKLDVHKPVQVTPFLDAESTQVTLEEALLSGAEATNASKLDTSKLTIRGKGTYLNKLSPGDSFSVSGAWQVDERYGGQQFHVLCRSLDQQAMSVDNMKQYLSSGSIKGVGPSTARKIVDALDESDLRQLFKLRENKEKIDKSDTTISKKLIAYPGFGKKTVNTIMNGMRGNHGERQIILGLLAQGFSVTIKNVTWSLWAEIIIDHDRKPYLLVEDVREQLILRAIVSSKYTLTFICIYFRYKALASTLLTRLPRKKASVSTANSDWPVAFCTPYLSGQQRTGIVV